MNLLLALLICQGPPTEKSVDDLIEAFLKGGPAAREDLVKRGAPAIRPLLNVVRRAPDKIGSLLFEIKKSLAHPDCGVVLTALANEICVVTIETRVDRGLHSTVTALGIPVFLDDIDPGILKARTYALNFRSSVPVRVILDDLCDQIGLDYGIFHNHLVIGHPERLWPSDPPRTKDLTAEETARAKTLLEKLDSDEIEVRDAAARALFALGNGVVPLLKTARDKGGPEYAARCTAVMLRLEFRMTHGYGPSATVRQPRKDPQEIGVHRQLENIRMDLDFQKAKLGDLASYLQPFTGLPIELQENHAKLECAVRLKGPRLIDALSLITQSRGLDFCVQGRKIVIDTRERIDLLVPRSK